MTEEEFAAWSCPCHSGMVWSQRSDYDAVHPGSNAQMEQERPIRQVGPESGYERNCREAYKLVQDLDRCVHGRHDGDPCFSCPGGISDGNPYVRPGAVIGYTVHGLPLAMPERGQRHLRAAWLAAGRG